MLSGYLQLNNVLLVERLECLQNYVDISNFKTKLDKTKRTADMLPPTLTSD